MREDREAQFPAIHFFGGAGLGQDIVDLLEHLVAINLGEAAVGVNQLTVAIDRRDMLRLGARMRAASTQSE
jgi:hypothetical protein